MQDHLNSSIQSDHLEINNFIDFSNYFYKTDHHWNYKGSYKGYQDIIKMINTDEARKYNKEIHFNSKMIGSKSKSVGGTYLFKEDFVAYDFIFPNHDIFINNKKVNSYGNYSYIIKKQPEIIDYGDYYGNDVGLLEFDFHQPEKDNILILGESYDNAINELLASHFNKTYNVDLRHYKIQMNEEFNIFKFVKDYKIKKVLYIGNHSFYTGNIFLLKEVE